jgi:hypothetical protein
MRLGRFLLSVSVTTTFCLLYVYQQTEIFHLAYAAQNKVTAFQDLLDKNTLLRYNIGKGASLTRIGNKIAQGSDFQMPDTYQLVKLEYSSAGIGAVPRSPKRESLASRLFGIKQQAEAKTINP